MKRNSLECIRKVYPLCKEKNELKAIYWIEDNYERQKLFRKTTDMIATSRETGNQY